MRVKVEDDAKLDLRQAADFYDACEPGLGDVYLASVRQDIKALSHRGGIHRKRYGKFVDVSFPFRHAIYYIIDANVVKVQAIIDTRRGPEWIRRRLGL